VVTALRPPTVAGVAGGVGTTTVAVALRGRDDGTARPHIADIVVCRATLDSLGRVADVLDRVGPGPRPVLAVTLDGARLPRGPLRDQLMLLEPGTSAVVLLPRVRRWRTLDDPLPEVATLLVGAPERLPRPVRSYAAALWDLAAAVADSGRLAAPAAGDGPDRHAQPAPAPDRPVERDRPRRPQVAAPPVAVHAGPGLQAVPIGRAERRAAPPVLAAHRPVATPARTPPSGAPVPPRPADGPAPRRGIRITTAPPRPLPDTRPGTPVERVG
jgi:hypothetical protein